MFRSFRKSSGTAKIRAPKRTFEIDGCTYRTKRLRDLHESLMKNPYVKTFSLPTVDVELKEKNKKYGAKKIEINGYTFDSIMEGLYYLHLLDEQGEGIVTDFDRQVTFELQPKFRDEFSGKTVRAITYIADFVVHTSDGKEYIIDVKGQETPEFKLKRKLFEYKYRDKCFMCVQWVARQNAWENLDHIKLRRREARKERLKEEKIANG